jgi:hypothetical protein
MQKKKKKPSGDTKQLKHTQYLYVLSLLQWTRALGRVHNIHATQTNALTERKRERVRVLHSEAGTQSSVVGISFSSVFLSVCECVSAYHEFLLLLFLLFSFCLVKLRPQYNTLIRKLCTTSFPRRFSYFLRRFVSVHRRGSNEENNTEMQSVQRQRVRERKAEQNKTENRKNAGTAHSVHAHAQ